MVKKENVFTYFWVNLCNVLGAKINTAVHLLTLESICVMPWVRLARRKTGLSPPVKYFTDCSKAVLLLWIFYVFVLSCACYVFMRVCLYVLCGHLLGKGRPLGSPL